MVHIHLFGYLRLLVDGQPYRFKALPKTSLLLTYLLLNRDSAVSRDHLAFLLWDDVSEEEARANLRRHLHDLLKALPPGEEWLVRDMKTVQWNKAAPFWLDMAEFEALCQDTSRLTKAVAFYTGDLMQAHYEDWIVAERERFQSIYISTLSRLMVRERERGDIYQAMNYARQLLSHDPLREDILRDYMHLRHASGDRAGALKLYQQFKVRLAEELGVDPMSETADLYQELSKSLAPIPLTAKPAIGPAAVALAPPNNLPARVTSFVGRQEELNHLCALIGDLDSPVRLLTITGPGGTGKTRLAIETASRLYNEQAELFPDGFYFVGLAEVSDPSRVLERILGALEIRSKPGQSVLEDLVADLKGKRLLLVLDNLEHLLGAVPLLAELLSAVPNLRLLVTSQALLHLYGEYEFSLSPLALPTPDSLPRPADLLSFAAVRLFVERLQAVQPYFQLTAENGPAIIDICRSLDGMPLALELAAARGRMFSPEAILMQLSKRLKFLSSRASNLPNRHQTLRATIDWSYNLLADDERRFFACVAIFVGSFTAEAALAVYTPTDQPLDADIFELLEALVDRNMLRPLMVVGNEAPRFRMLQTLRDYGLEQLAEAPDYQQRYGAYYLSLAEEGSNGFKSEDQAHWIHYIRGEENNINAAMSWFDENRASPENEINIGRMVVAMSRFWQLQGRVKEVRYWVDRAYPFLSKMDKDLQVRLLNERGNILQIEGEYQAAEADHQQALEITRQAGMDMQLAHTLHFLAFSAGRQGQYDKARPLFQECLSLYRRLPDITPIQLARLLNNLAIVHKRLGEYEEAIALLEETLVLKRMQNDNMGLPSSLANLGNLLVLQGNPAAAATHYREALLLRQQVQDKAGLVSSINQIASLAVVDGLYEQAASLYAAADALRQAMSIVRTADIEDEYQRDMALLKSHLNPVELLANQVKGSAMTMEDAADFALNSLTRPAAPIP